MNNLNLSKKSFTPNRNFGPYSKFNRNYPPQGSGSGMGMNNYANQGMNRPYFSDKLILSRVTQYLQNTSQSVNIDFDHMADELRRQHLEYRRKKRTPFKNHLRKAVDVIVAETPPLGDCSLLDDDDEDEEIIETNGRKSPQYAFEGDGDVNSLLELNYSQHNKRRRTEPGGEQELITITSDEDNNDASAPTPTPQPQPQETSTTDVPQVTQPLTTPARSTGVKQEAGPSTAAAAKVRKRKALEPPSLLGSKRFKGLEPSQPTTTFASIGGNEKVLQEVTQLLIHMRHPEVYKVLGVSPPRGFLLHGPPGSGKTLLAHAIAGELKIPLLKVAAPELVGGLSGQSEERIRELFEQGVALAPCVLFIDEVDAITPHRENAHREMERRIVAQLLSSLDELANTDNGEQVLVIGATNRPDSLDPALRRAGRFDREVCLGIPDRQSRESILRTLCHVLRLAPGLQLEEVAVITPGYVGADLKALVAEAAIAAVNRLFKSIQEPDKVEEVAAVETSAPAKEDTGQPAVAGGKEEGEGKSAPEATRDAATSTEPMDVEAVAPKPVEESEEDGDIQVLENDDMSDEPEVVKEVVGGEVMQAGDLAEPAPPTTTPTTSCSLLHSPALTVQQLEGIHITMEDFRTALKSVQPSAKREGFATVPDVKWEDIGSLQDIRNDLQMAILAPVKYPLEFACMGLTTPTGVLLCGPPGCGKTLLAKAVANEAGINFISVKGPELLNMYVGESERAVRQCFQRARSSQPCVIFFDEIDALCPKRTNMENGASRVVNQLLTEMDGMEARPGVFLMAATNRPDIVDPAVMRPGRLDKVLYVGLPATEDREDILRAVTKGGTQPLLGADVELGEVARDPRCEGYTGADLAALVREASMCALREHMGDPATAPVPAAAAALRVCARHFTTALTKIRPSVSERDKKRYEDLRLQYATVPSVSV